VEVGGNPNSLPDMDSSLRRTTRLRLNVVPITQ
jgi:hypothetical protein